MALPERLISTQYERKKQSVKKRKTQRASEKEKERGEGAGEALCGSAQHPGRYLGSRVRVCVHACVGARAAIGWGTRAMLALLILNLEQSGKYTPLSQREPEKCYRTHFEWPL